MTDPTKHYTPAPRYLGKKLTKPLVVAPSNAAILAEAPELVRIGLERGWIKPPKEKPMTDAQIQTYRLKGAKA